MGQKDKKRFYIIDGSSYIYRAFYAIRSLSNSKGLPTNAVYGFARMLLKIMKEDSPDYLAVAFDSKGKNFRHEIYPEYKAHRPEMPEELVPQIPYIRKLVEILNIPVIKKEGIEADDLIGSLAKRGEAEGLQVTIVSGDKDMMQLLNENIRMLDTLKDKSIGANEVVAKFGVPPDKVIEVMGLMGDSSDNIPGVPGVGPKTAQELIAEFGDIENLIAQADQIKKKGVREKVKDNADLARLSKRLVTIDTNLPIDVELEELTISEPDNKALLQFLRELEFEGLVKELGVEDCVTAEGHYETICDIETLKALIEKIKGLGFCSVDTETTNLDPISARLVGVSISIKGGEGYYIPLRHEYSGVPNQLPIKDVLEIIGPILEDPKIEKYGQNIKYDLIVLANEGIRLSGITFDTMVAAYLVNSASGGYSLGKLSQRYLNLKASEYKDVAAKKAGFWEVDIETATDYAAEDADLTLRLKEILEPLLKDENLTALYNDMELPLVSILGEMEMAGVKLDTERLGEMSDRLGKDLFNFEKDIYALAGEEFNINSPKQLGEILFEKLGLNPGKKTKTGLSTDVKVLEKLAVKHPIAEKLLNYRQLMKLKSTYTDALPKMINEKTGRIHTSYNQTVTATGRLSSSNPNLQNIPIKNDMGKDIRKAFIVEEGKIMISADYSQIELRLLAHLSGDKTLTAAFNNGEDIHERTALELFGGLPGLVTSDMRRIAKTVNFGVIYGMQAFGLSEALNIPRGEASRFIENYFKRYKRVEGYMEETIQGARDNGYVTTLFGRKRPIPDIKAEARQIREFAERTAFNTTIQGSAADIIKVAMINISRVIKEKGLKSLMVMQVHDELVFEVPQEEESVAKEIIKREMERVIKLSVPLIVDIHSGLNWDEAH
ncbi:MAG: DNA polymerase I [Nitrospinota bacterium]|nr:DNA polymerase I [Nitrospinota bacterium]